MIANAFVRKLRHPPYLTRTVKGHHNMKTPKNNKKLVIPVCFETHVEMHDSGFTIISQVYPKGGDSIIAIHNSQLHLVLSELLHIQTLLKEGVE